MNYDYLINKAEDHWRNNQRLPIDLFYKMLSAGLDVDGLEKQFKLTNQYD